MVQPFPCSSMSNLQPFNTNDSSNLFNGTIDWNDPALYRSLPSLSDLLDGRPSLQETLLPAVPQTDAPNSSPHMGASLHTVPSNTSIPGHDHLDVPCPDKAANLPGSQDKATNIPGDEKPPSNSCIGTTENSANTNNSSWGARNPNRCGDIFWADLQTP
jgi:hypothetical protein